VVIDTLISAVPAGELNELFSQVAKTGSNGKARKAAWSVGLGKPFFARLDHPTDGRSRNANTTQVSPGNGSGSSQATRQARTRRDDIGQFC
jgi:hypothetical protein